MWEGGLRIYDTLRVPNNFSCLVHNFQFLNNITCISTHFFTPSVFKKKTENCYLNTRIKRTLNIYHWYTQHWKRWIVLFYNLIRQIENMDSWIVAQFLIIWCDNYVMLNLKETKPLVHINRSEERRVGKECR